MLEKVKTVRLKISELINVDRGINCGPLLPRGFNIRADLASAHMIFLLHPNEMSSHLPGIIARACGNFYR